MDDADAAFYAPTVDRIRRWPSMRMQFDVYFHKFTRTADGSAVDVHMPDDA